MHSFFCVSLYQLHTHSSIVEYILIASGTDFAHTKSLFLETWKVPGANVLQHKTCYRGVYADTSELKLNSKLAVSGELGDI